MNNMAGFLIACALLPVQAFAQSDDAAYCSALGNLASRYLVSDGAQGGGRPDGEASAAIAQCNKGNFAVGIPAQIGLVA